MNIMYFMLLSTKIKLSEIRLIYLSNLKLNLLSHTQIAIRGREVSVTRQILPIRLFCHDQLSNISAVQKFPSEIHISRNLSYSNSTLSERESNPKNKLRICGTQQPGTAQFSNRGHNIWSKQ